MNATKIKTTQHTPGPWAYKHISVFNPETPEKGLPHLDCSCHGGKEWLVKAEANARLIAAAPELLEALTLVMEEMKSRFDYETATEEENAAFCKAEAVLSKINL